MNGATRAHEDGFVKKPKPIRSDLAKGTASAPTVADVLPRWLPGQLPGGPGTRALRQAAVLQMQRQLGNASVQRMLARQRRQADSAQEAVGDAFSGPTIQRACQCGGACGCGGKDELVQMMPDSNQPSGYHLSIAAGRRDLSPGEDLLQARCACEQAAEPGGECAECRQKRLNKQPEGGDQMETGSALPAVNDVLRSRGEPMDRSTRISMESRFGHDFSRVRLHKDPKASESARALNAQAYTVGQNIVFDAGRYSPETPEGQHLLAHELVHVLQQKGSGSAVQAKLPVGSAQDAAESEADRLANQIAGGASPSENRPVAVTQTPRVLRRQPTSPQRVGESRKVTLPQQRRGQDVVQIHVIRKMVACPCRKVPDVRQGVFYNPDLDNLAIAYRRCRGRRTTDVYGQLQSNARGFLTGQAPEGTARIGIDVNVFGRSSGGRIVLEAIGTNQGGRGVGGRGQVVYRRGQWRLYLEPQFVRRLQALPGGRTQNELQLSLGGKIGDVTFRVDLSDLLDPTQRRGTGTICIPVGSNVNICPFIEAGEGRGVTGGVGVNVPLGGPEVRKEECFQCYCPPPVRKYECYEDVLPRDETITEQVEVGRQRQFRYYFRLDRTAPSEDGALRSQSDRNLSELATQVQQGGSVSLIYGYASPEASERHNEDLSERRAIKMKELIRGRVGAGAELPEPTAGGELLGSRPAATPSSRLGDIITENGFRSAEDLSVLLLGEEIPRPELAPQFLSLFNALTEPADRLAVFGLTPADSIAPRVLAAIDRFVQSRGRGRRPWERIFRLLRVGVATVTWTETEEQTSEVRHPGSLTRVSEDQCKSYAEQAEATGKFGEIHESAKRPTTSSEDSDVDCLVGPRREDTEKGCDYEIPARMRGRPSAPSVAPRSF